MGVDSCMGGIGRSGVVAEGVCTGIDLLGTDTGTVPPGTEESVLMLKALLCMEDSQGSHPSHL